MKTNFTVLLPEGKFEPSERTQRDLWLALEKDRAKHAASSESGIRIVGRFKILEFEDNGVIPNHSGLTTDIRGQLLSYDLIQEAKSSGDASRSQAKNSFSVAKVIERIRTGEYSTQEEIAKDLERISAP